MRQKNPNRVRAAAAAAQRLGEDFETGWVARHHEAAFRLGIFAGPAEHNEPHGKIVRGQWIMVKPGVADFTAILYNGVGTIYAAEAKSRSAVLKKSEVSPKQQAHLNAVVRGGGFAFLLARFTEGGPREYAVPWLEVPWRVKKSAESVDAEALSPWIVPAECECFLDPYCPVRGVPVRTGQRVFPRE